MICRICGCSEHEACALGCAWANPERDLCTSCYEAAIGLAAWLETAHTPNLRALGELAIAMAEVEQPEEPLIVLAVGGL